MGEKKRPACEAVWKFATHFAFVAFHPFLQVTSLCVAVCDIMPEMCTKCSLLRGPLSLPTYTQAMSNCSNSQSPVRTCELDQSAEEKQLWKRSIKQCGSSSRVQKMSSSIEDIGTSLVACSVPFEDVARVWTLNRPKKNQDKKASEPHV